ncbi:MAG: hypothetical protein ACXAC6_17155 [Candidatus Hodarchaeales archaeon]
MENNANENDTNKKSRLESIKDHFSKRAEEELGDDISSEDIGASIFILIVCGFFGLAFITHQTGSTGFFTSKFSTLEMVMLYGMLLYWITTSVLILIGQKNPSRNLDSYGGLLFAAFATVWLIVVFPFDFTYFAEVFPVFLRFLLQLISNEIAFVILFLLFIGQSFAAIYAPIERWYVRKARAQNRKYGEKNEQ